jgi:hypothetical protein
MTDNSATILKEPIPMSALTPQIITKKWYASKTIIINLIAVVTLLIQTQTGFVISPADQVGILAFVNLVLRMVTNTGIEELN